MTDSNLHFRSVLRGYDTAQVDRHVHELTQASATARQEADERAMTVSTMETAQSQLRSEVERHAQRVRTLEEAQTKAITPTYAALGERIGSILALADKEAVELRARAATEVAQSHARADEGALATRRDADRYAAELRTTADAKAARVLEDARRKSDSLLDDADRQAVIRREEAEALYELARAKCATEAVDFETTLAARRDASALEFAADVSAAEQQLSALRLRAEESRIESDLARQDCALRSAQEFEQATMHARKLVAEARVKAEHIRDDSERELAAATQRRDSINVQLSNVRQMIAALGGATIINPLEGTEPDAGQTTEPTKDKAGTAGTWQRTEVAPSAWQPKDISPAAWQPRDSAPVRKLHDAPSAAASATPSAAPAPSPTIKNGLPAAGQRKDALGLTEKGSTEKGSTDEQHDKADAPKPGPSEAVGAKS